MREVGSGRYQLIRELGRGGMGVVWLGRDTVLGRDVAVKELVVPGGVPAAERAVYQERVLREARISSRLADPAVVTVHDLIKEDDQTYIVMELIKAPTLAELVERSGPLDARAAATLAAQLLSALEVAHEAGVVHRDVKPGNVMVPARGSAKLTDFGIAQQLDDPGLTATGSLIGSPAYMSPERLSGGPASPAWDLWALGATLFFATEGHNPFERGTTSATLLAVMGERPRPRSTPGPLAELVIGLLEPDPELRLRADRARRLVERALAVNQDFTAPVDPPTVRTPPVGTPPALSPGPAPALSPGTSPSLSPGAPPAPSSAAPGAEADSRRRTGRVLSATLTPLFAVGAVVLLYFTVFRHYLPPGEFSLGVPDRTTTTTGVTTAQDRPSSAVPTSSPAMQPVLTVGPDGDIGVYTLMLFQDRCLNWVPAKGVGDIPIGAEVGCYGPHDVEVMASVGHGTDYEQEAPYPSVEELSRRVAAECTRVFLSDRVKGEDKEATLRFWVLIPTAEAWRLRTVNGYRTSDRSSSCLVGRADGAKLTEPVLVED
ncbi:serine/threonine-protein kinase [Saccharothrix xinjiangensis]|uniref:non-specific serine/threonine protein kinase n=1 Tax=Saccharothrix xinjiangensis TaxID=204798 RepID=A0ABV9XYD9_9PSEU